MRKLEAYAALDPLALERRCRNRGLWTHSGSDQLPPSKSTLLQRLQCFEVYWSGRASDPSKARTTDVSEREPTKEVMDDIDGTPVMDDIDGTPIQTPLFAELQQQRVLRNLRDVFLGQRRSISILRHMSCVILRT